MSASREELHRVIEKLREKDIESLLHLLNRIVSNYDEDELTEEELKEIEEAEARMAKGEYIDLNDLKKEYGL
ncbi:MAG: hypothetical protein WC834_00385 [Eubacteriales bacterium]